MNRDIVRNMVNHLNEELITISCNNARAGKASIDANYALCVAQSRYIVLYNLAWQVNKTKSLVAEDRM